MKWMKKGLEKWREWREKNWKRWMIQGSILFNALYLPMSNIAIAAAKENGKTQVLSGLDKVKTLFLGIVAAMGVIVAGYYVVEFVDAWNKNDGSGMRRAGKGVAGGLVEAFITGILAFIGV